MKPMSLGKAKKPDDFVSQLVKEEVSAATRVGPVPQRVLQANAAAQEKEAMKAREEKAKKRSVGVWGWGGM